MSKLSLIHTNGFKYVGLPVICILILALTTYVSIQILKQWNYMGIRLDGMYRYLFDGSPDDNSHMEVTIQTKDCTIEATYSGEAYQIVKATEGSEKCKVFNYENGDRPSPINQELVNQELTRAYNRKPKLT